MNKLISGSVVVLAFALAAGVGCRKSPERPLAGGPAPSPERGAARPRIRIGYLPITDHLTVIAKARSKLQNVDLELVKFGAWPEIAEALRGNALDGAFLLAPMALNLRQKGLPIKAILLGHRNGSALVVREGGEIMTPAGLAGKKIAIPSRFSTHNILIHKLLQQAGLDAQKDVTLLEMKPPEMVNALATGQVDAFIVAEPFAAQAEIARTGRVLALSKDIWPEHVCCILNVREPTIAEHPAAVQDLVTALVDAGHFIAENGKEAAALSTEFLGQRSDVIEHVLAHPKDRVTFDNLVPQLEDIVATERYLTEYGIPVEPVEPASYIDDRFAKTAYGKP